MARLQKNLVALVVLGLCATAMAGPWTGSRKSSDSISSGFADVSNAMKDIQNQARININTAANAKLASSAAGRSLLQEDTISMNDASEQVIRAQKNMDRDSNSYIVGRSNRALLEKPESMKMWEAVDSIRGREKQLEAVAGRTRVLLGHEENPFKILDAVASIRGKEKQLEAVAGRTRVLLEKPESMKMWEAVDSIRGREKQLEAVAGRTRVLLEKPESMKMWEAVDSIRGREKQLEAVAGRTRVLLGHEENSFKILDAVASIRGKEKQLEAVAGRTRVLLEKPESMKMWEAVDSIRGREKQLEAVAGRTRVLLQDEGKDHSSDRMTANHMRISAAGDTVAQAFSRMAMSTKSRINQSELRVKQNARVN